MSYQSEKSWISRIKQESLLSTHNFQLSGYLLCRWGLVGQPERIVKENCFVALTFQTAYDIKNKYKPLKKSKYFE